MGNWVKWVAVTLGGWALTIAYAGSVSPASVFDCKTMYTMESGLSADKIDVVCKE